VGLKSSAQLTVIRADAEKKGRRRNCSHNCVCSNSSQKQLYSVCFSLL